MTFDLETYGRIAGKLEVDDLELEMAFSERPLAGDVLRCIGYFHDVEHHTTCYLRNLLNTRAHHDPEITDFLTIWNYEEHWHGHALGRVLEAHAQPAGRRVARMRQRLGWKITASPLGWMALSAATKHFLAVHMAFGVVNEWTTQAGYARLIAVAEHPTLTELLRRIMKQEGRHIDYYRSKCTELLGGVPAAQRTARMFLRTVWNPVGAKVMPPDDTRHLVRTLFHGEDGSAVVRRIDRRIDALPGLAGLHLVQNALAGQGEVTVLAD